MRSAYMQTAKCRQCDRVTENRKNGQHTCWCGWTDRTWLLTAGEGGLWPHSRASSHLLVYRTVLCGMQRRWPHLICSLYFFHYKRKDLKCAIIKDMSCESIKIREKYTRIFGKDEYLTKQWMYLCTSWKARRKWEKQRVIESSLFAERQQTSL